MEMPDQEMQDTSTENKPWQGSEVDAPPYNPHPPVRSIGVLSTSRREPHWTMAGRGEEMCFEYKKPGGLMSQLVRARLIQTRPVPQQTGDPQSYMTHQIEYIVGGIGLEWVRLDENKKTVKQKLGYIPPEHQSEPFLHVTYKVLTGESAKQPAPGEYPIVSTCSNRLSPHQKTARLDNGLERFSTTYEKRPQMPDSAAYVVNELHTSKSSPCFGFGARTAPRFPDLRKQSGPEPGAYTQKSSLSAKGIVISVRRKERDWKECAPKGSEPGRYAVEKGLQMTEGRRPTCRLNTSSNRPSPEDHRLPKEVGPGTYDVNHKLVSERSPVMTYAHAKGEPRKRNLKHDRPLSHYATFC